MVYFPSFSNFTTKRIQYFGPNNTIIADTLFDNTGNWIKRYIQFQNGNIKTQQTLDSSNAIIHTNTFEYDDTGRLIKTTGDYNTIFTYNANNTITASSSITNDYLFNFSINSSGLINYRINLNDNTTISLNFQNQNAIEYLNDGNVTGTFTYYSNPMPTNLLKNITEMNNTILSGYRLEHLPSNCNAYLKNWLWMYRYEREFDDLNYQTHVRDIYINTNTTPNTESITSETFFIYN